MYHKSPLYVIEWESTRYKQQDFGLLGLGPCYLPKVIQDLRNLSSNLVNFNNEIDSFVLSVALEVFKVSRAWPPKLSTIFSQKWSKPVTDE